MTSLSNAQEELGYAEEIAYIAYLKYLASQILGVEFLATSEGKHKRMTSQHKHIIQWNFNTPCVPLLRFNPNRKSRYRSLPGVMEVISGWKRAKG